MPDRTAISSNWFDTRVQAGYLLVITPRHPKGLTGKFFSRRQHVPENIAVFLDFQNVHLIGHNLYGHGVEPYRRVPDPARLADLIADRRKRPSNAARISVYRGRPDPNLQPTLTAANDARTTQWDRDPRVRVFRRPLNYRGWPNVSPQEKGVDVQLAVDFVSTAFSRDYDALVLFSSDTDLLPALEAVVYNSLGHVEVACWSGSNFLRFPGGGSPWHHIFNQSDWAATTEDWQGRV